MSCACACAYIPERELRPSRFSSFLPRPALLAGTGVGTAVAPLHHTFLPPCLGISQNVPCDVRECVCVFLLSFSVCSSDVHCRNLEQSVSQSYTPPSMEDGPTRTHTLHTIGSGADTRRTVTGRSTGSGLLDTQHTAHRRAETRVATSIDYEVRLSSTKVDGCRDAGLLIK